MRILPLRTDRIAWAAILLSVLLALWFLTWLVAGDAGRLLGYVNALGFWAGIVSLVAAACLAWRRVWPFAVMAGVFGLAILSHGSLPVLAGADVPAGAPRFRLVAASLRNLNDDMESAARTLLAADPDVLVVQESDRDRLIVALDRISGAHWNSAHRKKELIACRCRIDAAVVDQPQLRATLDLPGGPVTVWNVRAPKAYNELLINRSYFAALAEDITQTGSGIAAGDFNSTPWNEGYRTTAAVARDAWHQAGWGPGFTFPTPMRRLGTIMPLMRIDHVFATPDFVPVAMRVIAPSAGADHYPVVVDFARAAR